MHSAPNINSIDQRKRLNNLYRFQRHFYDLTRATFLFGRDTMLRQIAANNLNGNILEIGCGTGRNLTALARLAPNAKLFGLDAADEMLKTAEQKVSNAGFSNRTQLEQALAEEFDYQETFGLQEPFDATFISYSLSMFPLWGEALYNALDNLKPGGNLYIVDFWDGDGLPKWLIRLRTWWLGLFHVSYRPEFLEFLRKLEREGMGELKITSILKNYAFIAHFQKT